ncbi:MAG: hypothetical protein MHMPM18_000286 [Marteilia pararefringens]
MISEAQRRDAEIKTFSPSMEASIKQQKDFFNRCFQESRCHANRMSYLNFTIQNMEIPKPVAAKIYHLVTEILGFTIDNFDGFSMFMKALVIYKYTKKVTILQLRQQLIESTIAHFRRPISIELPSESEFKISPEDEKKENHLRTEFRKSMKPNGRFDLDSVTTMKMWDCDRSLVYHILCNMPGILGNTEINEDQFLRLAFLFRDLRKKMKDSSPTSTAAAKDDKLEKLLNIRLSNRKLQQELSEIYKKKMRAETLAVDISECKEEIKRKQAVLDGCIKRKK